MIKFQSLNDYDNIWLTADSHYAHKNICRGTSVWDSGYRDFDTLEEMNQSIIKGLECVAENDALLHCGDVAFGGKDNISEYCSKCKGDIFLTVGNHDHNILNYPYIRDNFESIRDIQYLQFKGQKIVMCHYPLVVFHQSHKGARLAFGHVHGSNPGLGRSIDVGVDTAFERFREYRPYSFSEFVKLTDQRSIYLESHHNSNTN